MHSVPLVPLPGSSLQLLDRCGDLHYQFSEVLSLKQSNESFWCTLKPPHNVFAIFNSSGGEPFGHLFLKLAETRTEVIKNDESLQTNPTLQKGPHRFSGAISSFRNVAVVVMCDQTAEGNARARIEEGKNGLEDFSANAFKIDIDALGAGLRKEVLQRGIPMVDAGIEAKVFNSRSAFLLAASDAHNVTSFKLCDLAYNRPNRASSGCNDDSISGDWLPDLQ